MAFTISPNMGLTIPAVSNEPGPQYAVDINGDLSLVDSHDHSPGKGVPITAAGLNINTDLPFLGNNAIGLRSIRFLSNLVPISLPTDLQSVYVSGVDLYYNDGNGNTVRITQSGGIAGTPGSISGLVPPASVTYSSGAQTFVFQSAVNTPANIDGGSFIFRNITALSKGVTVQAAAALASNYSLTLPLLPVAQSFMTLDQFGIMATPIPFANGITASNIANNTITAAQIANATLTTTQLSPTAGILGTQLASQTITQDLLAVKSNGLSASLGNVGISASSGTFTTTSSTFQQKTTAQTATISIASPAVVTVGTTTGFFIGMPIKFTTTGALPTGLTAGTFYYVAGTIGGTTFNVSLTPGGANINTTGSQSGVHTATVITFSTTVATNGSPVQIMIIPDGVAAAQVGQTITSTGVNSATTNTSAFRIVRNATTVIGTSNCEDTYTHTNVVGSETGTYYKPPGFLNSLDTPTAGTYTYHLELNSSANSGNETAHLDNCKIVVYEL